MPIIRCFVSDDLKTKFNAEYINSVDSTGGQKFSEHADYVFCYYPKYYGKEPDTKPEVFATKKKLESDPIKFKKYFDILVNNVPRLETNPNAPVSAFQVHRQWAESSLGKNWKELIISFCQKLMKANSIRLPNMNDRLLIALTKADWKKVKSKIKPEKIDSKFAEYDVSDFRLVELKVKK